MSRIAKKPIVIPSGVTVSVDGRVVSVSGPKGSLTFDLDSHIQTLFLFYIAYFPYLR